MTKWLRYSLGALALLVVVLLASWPWVKARLQAVAVLKTLSHEPIPLPVRAVTASNVLTQDVAIPTANGTLRGRLYSPAGISGAPGMVIVHGVHHLGMNEPRLELFASAMASCGLQVLTPELPAIADYRIGPESVSAIGDSARWFAQQTGGKVSVLGLSFSGGLALLAAEQPAYAAEMKMVFAVGSQANMQRVARYYRTGQDLRPDGSVQTLTAHEYGPLVMEYEHMEDFASAADRAALSGVLKEHLYEDGAGERRALQTLTPAQRVVVAQLLKTADARTVTLLAANEIKHAREMEAVSPDRDLQSVGVPVFLLHGEADNVIPSAETLWLAKGLRPQVLEGALVSPLISHVEMGKSPGAADAWRLVNFIARMMRRAEQ
ncbi:alpha/beta hydrolase [Terriglobus albidus]|uniref:Alpha/beta hydrolase n=1 Tax=Terriglobus albidus TaxID=1592106 RepID=A0A5B9ED84_9BACT|nr:CocE/NonD family hydrolase [Terriglobus albidus]QEE28056.1 alpha/beta hydrolase [Terriglobus albidus]